MCQQQILTARGVLALCRIALGGSLLVAIAWYEPKTKDSSVESVGDPREVDVSRAWRRLPGQRGRMCILVRIVLAD